MKLIVLKNNVPINEVEVKTPDIRERYEIFVGRADDCHVLIDDPLISRHHFVIKNDGKDWYCLKLTQLGAVLVNGKGAPKMSLNSGDEIKCGIYSFVVSDLPEVEPLPEVKPVPMMEPVLPVETLMLNVEKPVLDIPNSPLMEDTGHEIEEIKEELETPTNSEPEVELYNSISDNVDAPSDTFSSEEESTPEVFGEEGGASLDSFQDEDESNKTNTDNEGTKVFKAFVNYQLVLFGEHSPYDRFQLDQDEVYIGRDIKKCQIILNDPEVSSVHAVLRRSNTEVTLEDLNSSNGTILNGERINKATVSIGDEFIIGGTTFTLEVKSDLLEAEAGRLMPVEAGQVIEQEEIEDEEVSIGGTENLAFDSNTQEKSILKRIWKNPAQRKMILYVGVALAVILLILPDEKEVTPETKTVETSEATKTEDKKQENPKPVKKLSKELENQRNMAYELGIGFFEQSKYFDALKEFQTVAQIDGDYKKVQTYLEQTKIGLKRIEELEAQKRAEEERIKNKKIIDELLVKAREAVKERQVVVAESLFSQIIEKDPENMEIQQLKLELESWQQEQQRIALEKTAKEMARKAMVDALSAGKTFYLKKEWYRSVLKLEEFLRRKGNDEDLVKEASEMLSDARNQLASELGPLLGKARSLKEGQDLKAAYEAYLSILKVDPTNAEALNEVDDIKNQLESRSKKIYREAIISESLSLFSDAKEKFQEVQQISPTDSEYYKKASEKLKNYLE